MSSASTAEEARPVLARTWLAWPVTIVWIVLFAAAVAAGMASIWHQARGGSLTLQEGNGVSWSSAEFGFVGSAAGLIPVSDEARNDGLHRGDTMIAIDGRPVRSAVALPPEGSTLRVTVRGSDGRISTHRLARTRAHLEQFFASSGLSPGLDWWLRILAVDGSNVMALATGLLLFLRGRGRRLPLVLSFAFVLAALPLCNQGLWMWLGAYDSPAALSALLATNSEGVTFLIIGILLFPEDRFAAPWLAWFAVALVVVTLLANVVPYAMAFQFNLWRPIHMVILLAAAGTLLFRYRALSPGTEKQQIQWALFGFVAGVIALSPAVFMAALADPAETRPAALIWTRLTGDVVTAIAVMLFAGGLLVSLFKYRLYDAGAAISRSVSIGALTVALVAVFAGSEKIVELLGEEYFGHSIGVLAGGIGAALAAVLLVPLHHRLSHWAEHKFQKQLIRLRQGLPLLVGDMRETAPVRRIAAATLDSVTHGVRASRAALVFEGELVDARGVDADDVEAWRKSWSAALHDGFDIDKGDALFPLRVPLAADGHGRIGWLLLGPRPDGSFYGKDERETLAQIADPVARALEIAAAREKREAEQRTINVALLRASEESIRVFGEVARKLDLLLAPPGMAAE